MSKFLKHELYENETGENDDDEFSPFPDEDQFSSKIEKLDPYYCDDYDDYVFEVKNEEEEEDEEEEEEEEKSPFDMRLIGTIEELIKEFS